MIKSGAKIHFFLKSKPRLGYFFSKSKPRLVVFFTKSKPRLAHFILSLEDFLLGLKDSVGFSLRERGRRFLKPPTS